MMTDRTKPREGGVLWDLVSALADGPVPLSKLMKVSPMTVRTIQNRMSELRVNGWIEDTVTLTDEGRKALNAMKSSQATPERGATPEH